MRHLLLCALFLWALSSPAHAQRRTPPPLRPGDRVQLPSPTLPGRTVVAELVAVEPEWLAFRVVGEDPQVWTRRMEFIDVLRVSTGRSRARSVWGGALWGAFLGTAVGGVSGPLAARSLERSVGESVAILGVGGGLLGAGLGAVVGALRSPEQWVRYRYHRR